MQAESNNSQFDQANALVQVKKYKEALPLLDEELARNPKNLAALRLRSSCYSRLQSYRAALSDVSAYIHLSPSALSFGFRGLMYNRLREPTRAIADFTEALRLDPRFVNARGARAHTYLSTAQFEEALADCNTVIEQEPERDLHYSVRANVYDAIGKHDLAAKDRQTSARLKEQHAHPGNCSDTAKDGEIS